MSNTILEVIVYALPLVIILSIFISIAIFKKRIEAKCERELEETRIEIERIINNGGV